MQRIRFLVPFIIFLTLFLIMGGICYSFYSTKIAIEEEIIDIDKKIGQKESEVYERASFQTSILKHLYPKIGFTLTPYNVELPKITATKKKSVNYIEQLHKMKEWMVNELKHLKKVNCIKSQHQTEFGQYIGLAPDNQISKIQGYLATISNEINNAISACRVFLREAENNEVSDVNRKAELAAVGGNLDEIRTTTNTLITNISSKVSTYQEQINVKNPTKIQITKARKVMYDAHDLGVELVRKLTYITETIEGNEKFFLIPKIAESKARNTASQLLFLLHHNDIKFLHRMYRAGILPKTVLPDDEYGVGNLEYIALIADALINENSPRFNTNPYYLAGISLEEIVDSQELTIRGLLELNQMLKTKVDLVFNTRNPNDPVLKLQQNKSDIQNTTDTNKDRIRETDAKYKSAREELSKHGDDLADKKSDIEETLVQKVETTYKKLLRPIEDAIAAHKERIENLTSYFNQLKMIMKRAVKSGEGRMTLRADHDGLVIHADRMNHIYNINIGKSDNIMPGMRFLVYNDAAGKGKTVVKGMLEVLRMPQAHFAICSEVFKYSDVKIEEGDKISHPLFRKRRFLKVALIGKFEPPDSTITGEQLKQYLQELGVTVMDTPSVATELVILATTVDKIIPTDYQTKIYLKEFRILAEPDEMLVKDLLIYFKDQ